MLKREHIKQAIDAISTRNPEIGYTLDEMLGMGRITVPENPDAAAWEDNLYFYVEDQRATVKKYIYFSEGTVPIEQRLLIKYGEMAKKQELLNRGGVQNYKAAAVEIRRAGLELMVAYEIDCAIERLKNSLPSAPDRTRAGGEKDAEFTNRLIAYLEQVKCDTRSHTRPEAMGEALFRATVDKDVPALFTRFPFSGDSLMQIADANFEFFHVRFLLNCLLRSMGRNLFACVIGNDIAGLVFLAIKQHLFLRSLEIKYMASQRANVEDPLHTAFYAIPPLKGVGTFLVSGAWLYWKTGSIKASEFILDSEIGARRFYEALGLQPRGLSDFVLKHPSGRLLKTILMMTERLPNLDRKLVEEICELVKRDVRTLCKKAGTEREKARRNAILSMVRTCLESGVHPVIKEAVIQQLGKSKKKISEAEEMVRLA